MSLLTGQGEQLKRSGTEHEWRDGSAKVTIRGNLWYHQYEKVGGDAIDFVRRYFNKSYPEAMEYLLHGSGGRLNVSTPVPKKPAKPFALPQKNENMRRVFAYLLKHRKIDRDVLHAFAQKGMIYESAEYHNAVFVGFDVDGVPKHAHKRGTGTESTYKGNVDGSLPEYSFHWHGQSDCLYLFEAPIDMLSFISMEKNKVLQQIKAHEFELRKAGRFENELAAAACRWQQHSYAAACGVSDQVMWQMMKDNPNIETVCLCRDNDETGQAANERTSQVLSLHGVPHTFLVPDQKDWNEDLTCPMETEEPECFIQQAQ